MLSYINEFVISRAVCIPHHWKDEIAATYLLSGSTYISVVPSMVGGFDRFRVIQNSRKGVLYVS